MPQHNPCLTQTDNRIVLDTVTACHNCGNESFEHVTAADIGLE
jgi:hypothetical protein